eukprot:2461446-Pyramimonas_sp.AAC.1
MARLVDASMSAPLGPGAPSQARWAVQVESGSGASHWAKGRELSHSFRPDAHLSKLLKEMVAVKLSWAGKLQDPDGRTCPSCTFAAAAPRVVCGALGLSWPVFLWRSRVPSAQ